MARRTLTIKRIDPWSVLKVGFLANLVLLGILLLAGRVVWFFIERLELIGRACEVAESVGFQDCGLNGGNIFRNALLLGLLGVVVQTGILVFAAFLHNLIAELTGGITLAVNDDSATTTVAQSRSQGRSGARPGAAKGSLPNPAGTGQKAGQGARPPGQKPSVGAPTGSAPGAASAPQARPGASAPAGPGAGPGDTTRVAGRPGDLFGGSRPSAADGSRSSPADDGQPQRPKSDPQRPHGPSRP